MGIVVESIADTNEALITRTAPSGGGDGARCELAFANGEFLHCISSFPSFHTRVARLTGTARRAPARRGEGNFGGGDSATTGVDSASGGGGGGGGASSRDMDSAAGRFLMRERRRDKLEFRHQTHASARANTHGVDDSPLSLSFYSGNAFLATIRRYGRSIILHFSGCVSLFLVMIVSFPRQPFESSKSARP